MENVELIKESVKYGMDNQETIRVYYSLNVENDKVECDDWILTKDQKLNDNFYYKEVEEIVFNEIENAKQFEAEGKGSMTDYFNNLIEEQKKLEESKHSKKKYTGLKLVIGSIVGVTIIGLTAKACSDNNASKIKDSNNEAATTPSITEETAPSITEETAPSITEEEKAPSLNDYATIKYITEKEFIQLLQAAQTELKDINVTTEELAAFVSEVNKTVINSELKQLLMSSGVINEDEQLNRQNYLNALDKIRNAMRNAKTIIIDSELVGYPEYDALIEQKKANAVSVHISNMVSDNSSEKEMYILLDTAYEKIGEINTLEEATIAYAPIREYVNSENGKNMPNNMEEEIYKDLYKDLYDEISSIRINTSITDKNVYIDYNTLTFENNNCQKQITK